MTLNIINILKNPQCHILCPGSPVCSPPGCCLSSCLLERTSAWMSVLVDKSENALSSSRLLFSFPSTPDQKNYFTYSLSHLTLFITLASVVRHNYRVCLFLSSLSHVSHIQSQQIIITTSKYFYILLTTCTAAHELAFSWAFFNFKCTSYILILKNGLVSMCRLYHYS